MDASISSRVCLFAQPASIISLMTKLLDLIEDALGVVFFTGMFGAICMQVFARYILNDPLVWPMEFSTYCYIYIVYIGSVMAMRRGSHVSFDLIHAHMPARMKVAVTVMGNLIIISSLVYLMPSAVRYIGFIGDVRSSSLQIPWAWVLWVFPVTMGLCVIVLMGRTWQTLRGKS